MSEQSDATLETGPREAPVTTNSADDMPRQRPRVTVEELPVYAKCIAVQDAAVRRRIEDDLRAGLVKIGSRMLRGWP